MNDDDGGKGKVARECGAMKGELTDPDAFDREVDDEADEGDENEEDHPAGDHVAHAPEQVGLGRAVSVWQPRLLSTLGLLSDGDSKALGDLSLEVFYSLSPHRVHPLPPLIGPLGRG